VLVVIPPEWTVSTLGRCLAGTPSYGINAPAVPHSPSLPTYVRITDINEDGRLGGDVRVSVAAPGTHAFFLSDGDVVFARTGASVGKSYKYRLTDGGLVFAGFLIKVHPDPSVLLPDFLAQYVRTYSYWEWVRATSMRSGQPGINGREYAAMPLFLPSLKEQEAIAEALSDADAAIEALDALIAKKRDVKHAAMQQLLTGHTRLPGFSQQWEDESIGSLFTFQRTTALSRAQLSDAGEIGYIHYGDIHSRWDTHLDLSRHSLPGVDPDLAGTAAAVVDGDLVLADASEDLDGVGKAVEVMGIGSRQVIAGLHTVLLRPRVGVFASGFLGYVPSTPGFKLQARTLAAGLKVYGLSKSSLRQIVIGVPSAQEQGAIAQVLMDMDAEVEALVAERDKMRLVKQGMMQELLSGRVRLV
jgi:type I restriction enzyme S subunit